MDAGFAAMLKGSLWAWPALEFVHLVGIALLFGSLVLFELRALGLGATLPAAAQRVRDRVWTEVKASA